MFKLFYALQKIKCILNGVKMTNSQRSGHNLLGYFSEYRTFLFEVKFTFYKPKLHTALKSIFFHRIDPWAEINQALQ
jgi:hypothetical protein